MSRKSILVLGICAALFYVGYDWIDDNVEVVTVRVTGRFEDYYPKLFIVDDPPAVWIRAERPDRLWLDSVRANPRVVVRRGDVDIPYRAEVMDGDDDQERVDELFHAKYGVLDDLAAWIWRRDSVPIRLEPPDELAHDAFPETRDPFPVIAAPKRFSPSAAPRHFQSNNPRRTSRSPLRHHA
jgi:hypothetical protein